MDSRFDVLAKTIALTEGMPRREAVRRVGGAFAAFALTSLGVGCSGGGGGSSPLSPLPPGTSSTGRTPQGGGNSDCAHFCQNLPPGPQRGQCVSDAAHGTGLCYQCNGDASRLCAPASSGGAYVCCYPGQTCVNGQCVCPTGQGLCSGACVPLNTTSNCGSCGHACASGQSCCGTTCTNLQSDVNNCGTCGTKCSSGQTCVAGTCTCAGVVCGGTCFPPPAAVCCPGGPSPQVFPAGFTCCGGGACSPGFTCNAGRCVPA